MECIMLSSPGKEFRTLVKNKQPLQVLGTVNAYSAMLAESSGAKSIYLSGAGVANSSFGLPDLGMTSLSDVLEDARRITDACSLPLLVDVDTGWGHAFNIARTVKRMEGAGVAAIHIEDQIVAKRCGHRPNKAIVSMHEMGDRIKAAVDARVDPDFVIMARTDVFANQGLNATIERAQYFIELGADMIFPEALIKLEDYKGLAKEINAPILANITEFGKTPLFTLESLAMAGVSIALYPLSAFRAMSKAALNVYREIITHGTQQEVVANMQTREQLYEVLRYHEFENALDKLLESQDE